ncbi:hypothetical protein TNCV_1760161 [Trichonephila clavipes]|nr:hypothetical protein TNCV_1760161 [Trichonephila clavipes]
MIDCLVVEMTPVDDLGIFSCKISPNSPRTTERFWWDHSGKWLKGKKIFQNSCKRVEKLNSIKCPIDPEECYSVKGRHHLQKKSENILNPIGSVNEKKGNGIKSTVVKPVAPEEESGN